MPPRFTLGIEEEFQLIDPGTRELKSHIEEMLLAGAHLGEQIKPELHRSVVEVGTPVCQDIREARDAVKLLRRSLITMAEAGGVRIVAAGTHPISHWKDQEITDRARYIAICNRLRRLLLPFSAGNLRCCRKCVKHSNRQLAATCLRVEAALTTTLQVFL